MNSNTIEPSYRQRLHNVIPGGAHTYSRGDDQFPANAPEILERGEGAYVYDPRGNKYLDYGMGLRSVNIGYGNKEVADACYQEILKGNNLTRPSITELQAAELLTQLIPSVEMVKFAKHGSTVTSAAMKLSRAYTSRKIIAVPAEQPFFSFDDWFIGSTVMQRGVPEEMHNLTVKFNYNNIESLQALFDKYPDQIAAVMLEPATTVGPEDNFLAKVKNLCKANGAVFIIDEMITGFRWHMQGAQTYFDVEPDLCTFGKAMANGFAVAALGGKREIMEIGGIQNEGAERVFLTSTTHGAEMSALGAFIKTVEILQRDKVVAHFWSYGERLIKGMNGIAHSLGMADNFIVEGFPCSPNYITKDAEGNASLAFRTLFSQEMVSGGVLMPYVAISASHQDAELKITLDAAEKALTTYSKALKEGVHSYLQSAIIKPVFRKYNLMFSLKDKVVVVTGGNGLLGNLIIQRLKDAGAIAIAADIAIDTNKELQLQMDITDEESVKNAIAEVVAQHGRIDGWVNNAYPRTKDWGVKFEQIPVESWRKNVDMHMNGYFICCQAVLEEMKKQGAGSLINMSSIYGIVGPDFTVYDGTEMTMPAAYAAIKGGLVNLTRYLAAYYGPSQIRVNTVSPGGIFDNQPTTFVEQYERKVPMRKMGQPSDIAGAVHFLLADEAAYVTGHNLVVDGGWSII